jgi:transposase InsO family protein
MLSSREIAEICFSGSLLSVQDWYKNRRLMEPLGYISPAEFEKVYYEKEGRSAISAGLN